MRKHVWKQKALTQATKALFLAKYVLKSQDSGASSNGNTSELLTN